MRQTFVMLSTEVFCPAPVRAPFITVEPHDCQNGTLQLDKECRFTCASGFERQGSELLRCSYDEKPIWAPGEIPACKGTYNFKILLHIY